MAYLTEAEVKELQNTKLSRNTPFSIQGVSNSQLSIARHYGGCKYQGRQYVYIPTTDELIREDVVKWVMIYRKPKKAKETQVVSDLKKPCHDDPEHVCECYDNLPTDCQYEWCNILLHGGTWEDCSKGKDWKEPGPPAFEGD